MKRPPTYPTELAYPCCLPALGEFGKMPPHGGLAASLGERSRATDSAESRAARAGPAASADFGGKAPRAVASSGGGFA